MQKVCGMGCAMKVQRLAREEKARKAANVKTRLDRENLKTISDHKKDTSKLFHEYIRLRDAHKPYISCDQSPYQGQRHASRYRPRGSAGQLAYNFLNTHASCSQCNQMKSGNLIPYRQKLVQILTPEQLEEIETNNETRRYTKEYLKRFQVILKRRIKYYKRLRGQ